MVHPDPETPGTARSVEPRRRGFTILDGIILVAVLAVGFALARNYWRGSDFGVLRGMSDPQWTTNLVAAISSRFVCPAMLGMLIVRMRRPRPSLRRLVYQPGLAACLAGSVAMATGGAIVLSLWLFRTVSISSADSSYWPFVVGRIGPAVVTVWIALILFRRWKPERSWIDRTGCVLGAYWVLLGLYELGYYWGIPGLTPLIGI